MTKKHYTHTLSHSGFTLIELLITIVIIGILSTLGIVAFQSTQKKSRDLGRKTNLKTVSKALETYMNDKGVFPPSSPDGKILWCGTEAAPDAVACPWGYPLTDVATAGEDKTVYLAALPKDSNPAQTFFYEAVEIDGINKGYRLYAKLENIKDPDIPASGQYATNCGATTTHYCNYVLASETVPAPSPYVIIITPTNTPIPTNIPTPISTPIPTVQQCLVTNGVAAIIPNPGATVSVTLTGHIGTVLRWEYSLNNGAWQNWGHAGQTTISWSLASGYRFRAVLQNGICTEYSAVSEVSIYNRCGDVCDNSGVCSKKCPTAGLIDLWHMDELSGTTVADSIGGHTGTAYDTTVVDGKVGKARSFNNPSSYGDAGYINLGWANPLGNLTGPLTISAWIKPVAGGTIISEYCGGYCGDALFSSGTYLSFSDGTSLTNTGNVVVTPNTWHHITYTYNGTRGTMYLDGIASPDTTPAHWIDRCIGNISIIGSVKTIIGATDCGNQCSERGFNGVIDEFAIYNRALSADEVTTCSCNPNW